MSLVPSALCIHLCIHLHIRYVAQLGKAKTLVLREIFPLLCRWGGVIHSRKSRLFFGLGDGRWKEFFLPKHEADILDFLWHLFVRPKGTLKKSNGLLALKVEGASELREISGGGMNSSAHCRVKISNAENRIKTVFGVS